MISYVSTPLANRLNMQPTCVKKRSRVQGPRSPIPSGTRGGAQAYIAVNEKNQIQQTAGVVIGQSLTQMPLHCRLPPYHRAPCGDVIRQASKCHVARGRSESTQRPL